MVYLCGVFNLIMLARYVFCVLTRVMNMRNKLALMRICMTLEFIRSRMFNFGFFFVCMAIIVAQRLGVANSVIEFHHCVEIRPR